MHLKKKEKTKNYRPHTDFATPVNDSTNEIMEYQRIFFPRNPSNSVFDKCYFKENECMSPLSELGKLGNARLYDSFPEIVSWASRFKVDSTQVATVAEIYKELNGESQLNGYGWTDKDMWLSTVYSNQTNLFSAGSYIRKIFSLVIASLMMSITQPIAPK